jgi:hypothetical protein
VRLLGTLLTEKLANLAGAASSSPRDPHAQAIRDDLLKGIKDKRADGRKS